MRLSFSIILTIFFMALTFSDPARAQVKAPMTASQIRDLCASKYDIDFGICAGYVTAVAERLMSGEAPVCLSPAVSPQLLVTNVVKAWDHAPPGPQDSAAGAVEQALRQRFACPR